MFIGVSTHSECFTHSSVQPVRGNLGRLEDILSQMKGEEENQRRLGRLSESYYELLQSRIQEARALYNEICGQNAKPSSITDLRRDILADHLHHFTTISQLTAAVNLNSQYWREGRSRVVAGKHSLPNLDLCFRTLLQWTVSGLGMGEV